MCSPRGSARFTGLSSRLPIRSTPPALGEGTRELLQSLLKLSEDELQALKAKGVLTLPDNA